MLNTPHCCSRIAGDTGLGLNHDFCSAAKSVRSFQSNSSIELTLDKILELEENDQCQNIDSAKTGNLYIVGFVVIALCVVSLGYWYHRKSARFSEELRRNSALRRRTSSADQMAIL